MLLPKDNAFGIIRPQKQAGEIDTSSPGALMQTSLDAIVARYEDQYVKKAKADKITAEQQQLNDDVTNSFNSAIRYYRQRIEGINSLNFHRKQMKTAYSGISNMAGSIIRNESFYTEELLFIKVLFAVNWGNYHWVPADLQEDRAQGYWAGTAPDQLCIAHPPPVPLLASGYTFVSINGVVHLNAMPNPMYTYPPDILPRQLYLYLFYTKPQGAR